MRNEPKEAFPYKPPSKELYQRYSHLFDLKSPLPQRVLKGLFDKLIATVLIFFSLPILVLLKLAYVIEGFFIPENKGPLFFYYYAVSAGQIFRKYKIRLIKTKYIDLNAAKKGDWIAYAAEWDKESRTYVGQFAKKFYLDEIPQFFSVLKGETSIVGPRSLSVMHYERDLAQGNIPRKFLKAGMLGLGHINKGTSEMGNPIYEYEYLDQYLKRSSFSLFCLDLWIIWKGCLLILKGGGH